MKNAIGRTVASIAAVRALLGHGDKESVYVRSSKSFYVFDESSEAADDAAATLKPDNLLTTQAGRWILEGGFIDPIEGGDTNTALHYGGGSDGDAVLDGVDEFEWASLADDVYTLLRTVYCDTLEVEEGVTLVTNGFKIYCKTELIRGGTITNKGANGEDGVAAKPSNDLGGASEGAEGAGAGHGNGGDAGAAAGTDTKGMGGNGGAGGAGTEGSSGSGGAGGPGASCIRRLIQHITHLFWTPEGGILEGGAGGGQGGGGGGNGIAGAPGGNGGRGGSGGGGLFIAALVISGDGDITAAGGDGEVGTAGGGAAGGGGGGGGGAGGGYVFMIFDELEDEAGITAAGGAAGPGGAGSGSSGAGLDGDVGEDGYVVLCDQTQNTVTVSRG